MWYNTQWKHQISCSALLMWRPHRVKTGVCTCVCPPGKDTEQNKDAIFSVTACSWSSSPLSAVCLYLFIQSMVSTLFLSSPAIAEDFTSANETRTLQTSTLYITPHPPQTTLSLKNYAVNKADVITAHANHLSLDILALTETDQSREQWHTYCTLHQLCIFRHLMSRQTRWGNRAVNIRQLEIFLAGTSQLVTYSFFEYHVTICHVFETITI